MTMALTITTKHDEACGPLERMDRNFIPLARAALCLDCAGIFVLRRDGCPSCGSQSWAVLAKWMQERK